MDDFDRKVEEGHATRLDRAKSYIAIAESVDSKREAYTKAADEIIAWLAEDPTRGLRETAETLGRSHEWVRKLVTWRTSVNTYGSRATPFAGQDQRQHADDYAARKVLRERPEVIVEAIKKDPVVRRVVESAIKESQEEHEATRSKVPLGVPEPDVSFLMRMAGPLNRLHDAERQVRETWEKHSESANDEDRESVQNDIGEYAAKLAALITDWSAV